MYIKNIINIVDLVPPLKFQIHYELHESSQRPKRNFGVISRLQSIRYFRLKNERRWKICQAPRVVRQRMVNHAKFCTRSFVDAVDNGYTNIAHNTRTEDKLLVLVNLSSRVLRNSISSTSSFTRPSNLRISVSSPDKDS
jgi:hypothetical protein